MTSSATRRTKRQPQSRRPKSATIGIKRVYEDASRDDGVRIFVDRLWPRGLSKASLQYDSWPRQLTPSNDLRKWYRHDPKRAAEFRRRYLDELAAHRDELAALRDEISGRTATLLTATHSLELSHAAVLRDVLLGKRVRSRLSSKA
jgi:uncharacterized protein YeaO (DUF488 family)